MGGKYMKSYKEFTKEELEKELEVLRAQYKQYQELGLELNMARGKPCPEQLNLSMGMMDVLSSSEDFILSFINKIWFFVFF